MGQTTCNIANRKMRPVVIFPDRKEGHRNHSHDRYLNAREKRFLVLAGTLKWNERGQSGAGQQTADVRGIVNGRNRKTDNQIIRITGNTPVPTARLKNGGISRRCRMPKTSSTPNSPKMAPEAPADWFSG